jgi:hypothetical protein
MATRAILVTGSDHHYYRYLIAAIDSLLEMRCSELADISVIDFGLLPDQRSEIMSRGLPIRKISKIEDPRKSASLRTVDTGLVLLPRMDLRDHFPGYDVYVWMDADLWVQTCDFLEPFIEGARLRGAAVCLENGPGYRFTEIEERWWRGQMVPLFGRIRGTYLGLLTSINIGVMALAAKAPHWDIWKRRYHQAVARLDRLDVDQHAFFAALYLDRLDVKFLPAHYDWICTLSTPIFDSQKSLFCIPDGGSNPISILHLAGPAKEREYEVPLLSGGKVLTKFTRDAALQLRERFRAS